MSCPTRYEEQSSSIGFMKSVRYGFGVLEAAAQYRMMKLGLMHPRFLAESDAVIECNGYHYFPRDAVRLEWLAPAPKTEKNTASKAPTWTWGMRP